jgi:hypothetical protein
MFIVPGIVKNTDKDWLSLSEKATKFMEFLEIPMTDYNYIDKRDLYDFLMDKEKCEKLISKLKNKAFW